jgi:hypothetical protein
LTFYLENKEYEILINTMKNLSKKKQQSGFVILGMVKFSLKIFYQKISNDYKLLSKYLDCIKGMVNLIKVDHESNFEVLKVNLLNAMENNNWDEIQHLVFNFDYAPEEVRTVNKHNKQIIIGESADFNTESSTKLDNKLEISIHRDTASTTRNLNIISPVNTSVRNDFSSSKNLNTLKNDHIKFSRVNTGSRVKMPFLNLAVDITMSSQQIKKMFINEMTK